MRKLFMVAIFSAMLAACSAPQKPAADDKALLAQSCCDTKAHAGATCSGTKSCSACKNCKYCKHCSKDGGTCGVCK